MYRLLIVTQNQSVMDMFGGMEGWEALGFKPPRLRQNMQEAVECMHKHCIDAIALDDVPDHAELKAYLDEQYPNMPIFSVEDNAREQMDVFRELAGLLNRLHADDSNDDYDDAYLLAQQRERWMKRVLSGLVPTADALNKGLCLLRFKERGDVPCLLARLSLPQDDDFMTERWHYGGERLETALRNFFGSRRDHMLLHVAAVSPQEVRVLCYPQDEALGINESRAEEDVRETVEQIKRYIGLDMGVLEICGLNGLTAFTRSNT